MFYISGKKGSSSHSYQPFLHLLRFQFFLRLIKNTFLILSCSMSSCWFGLFVHFESISLHLPHFGRSRPCVHFHVSKSPTPSHFTVHLLSLIFSIMSPCTGGGVLLTTFNALTNHCRCVGLRKMLFWLMTLYLCVYQY